MQFMYDNTRDNTLSQTWREPPAMHNHCWAYLKLATGQVAFVPTAGSEGRIMGTRLTIEKASLSRLAWLITWDIFCRI